MDKLKPCPFCGAEATFAVFTIPNKNGFGMMFGVTCTECSALIASPDFKEEEQATEVWNRRADDERT